MSCEAPIAPSPSQMLAGRIPHGPNDLDDKPKGERRLLAAGNETIKLRGQNSASCSGQIKVSVNNWLLGWRDRIEVRTMNGLACG